MANTTRHEIIAFALYLQTLTLYVDRFSDSDKERASAS